MQKHSTVCLGGQDGDESLSHKDHPGSRELVTAHAPHWAVGWAGQGGMGVHGVSTVEGVSVKCYLPSKGDETHPCQLIPGLEWQLHLGTHGALLWMAESSELSRVSSTQ